MSLDPFSLVGKHILLTGASSGIGRAIAITCSEKGARVTLWARNKERLKETLSLMHGEGHMIKNIDMNDISAMSKHVLGMDCVDGIVHCAGTIKTCPTKYITRNDLNEVFSTNLFAPIELTTLLLEGKKINKGSSIVFISSISGGIIAQNGNAIYGASKGGIISYAKVLALELSPRKIRVNSILPGMVKTNLMKKVSIDSEQFMEDEKKYPLGYGEPNDVAYTVIFLLSEASRWMTGSNIIIDGGMTLQ
jgi:NAD(P)-dependent dehydrogenase (short-subunit alcohol dehydrogenase family)